MISRSVAPMVAAVALVFGSAAPAWAAPPTADAPATTQVEYWPNSKVFAANAAAECSGFVVGLATRGYRQVPYSIHPPAGKVSTRCLWNMGEPHYWQVFYT